MFPRFLRWIFSSYNYKIYKSDNFQGNIKIPDVNNKVVIYRDKWHIPHIYAENNKDLFLSQGYIHAQDRIWQMEMNRRIGQGKLAEAFGKDALNTDRLTRTIGFNRLAKEDYRLLSSKYKIYINSYVKGINIWLEKNKLPIEFRLSKINPEPWTVLDVLSWGRVLTWTLSHGWSGALIKQEIINKVGDDMADELAIFYPEENPFQINESINLKNFSESKNGPFLNKNLEGGGRGSNAWVISPEKSKTGRPILANDTHLELNIPGIWYLNHLKSNEDYHCTGSSVPGLPGLLIGHNDNIAWGITLAYTDVEDIFIEKQDVSDPDKYEYCNHKLKYEKIEEIIKVKNENEHTEIVLKTIHGPLIGNVINKSSQVVSLCSKSLCPNTITAGFFNINEAKNWDEFSIGVGKIKAPQLNIIYADIRGNIGLYVSGRVPIRRTGDGNLPVPGWNAKYDWISEIPHEEMPRIANPKCGYIISCNNKIIDKKYPYFLGNSFMNGYRAERIKSKIIDVDLIDIEFIKDLHMDCYSVPGKKIVDGLIKGLRTAKPKVQKLIDILNGWDFKLDKKSIGGTVYQVFLFNLMKNILEPHLGPKLTEKFLGVGNHPLILPVNELLGNGTESILRIFQNPHSKWLTSDKVALQIIEKSLLNACFWLEQELGYNTDDWEWGKIHQAEFKHILSIKNILRKVFNKGPYPISGDTDTVHQSAYNPSSPYHNTSWSPSNRFILDIGEWDNCLAISPPGQSGILGSKHYDDLVEYWMSGKYVPLIWDPVRVQELSKYTLIIKP